MQVIMLSFIAVNKQQFFVPAHLVIDVIVSEDPQRMTIGWMGSGSAYRFAEVHPDAIDSLIKQLRALSVDNFPRSGERDV